VIEKLVESCLEVKCRAVFSGFKRSCDCAESSYQARRASEM
jgi:hypothetical protein